MISFSLGVILIPYAAVLLLFTLLAFVNVYHLVHYGATGGLSLLVTFLFLAGATYILFFTWQLTSQTDWMRQVYVGSPFSTTLPSSL